MIGSVSPNLPTSSQPVANKRTGLAQEANGAESSDEFLGVGVASEADGFSEAIQKAVEEEGGSAKKKKVDEKLLDPRLMPGQLLAKEPLTVSQKDLMKSGYGDLAPTIQASLSAQKDALKAGASPVAVKQDQTFQNSINQLNAAGSRFNAEQATIVGAQNLARDISGPQSVGQGGLKPYMQAQQVQAHGEMKEAIEGLQSALAGMRMAAAEGPSVDAGAELKDVDSRLGSAESGRELGALLGEVNGEIEPTAVEKGRGVQSFKQSLSGDDFVQTLNQAKQAPKGPLMESSLGDSAQSLTSVDAQSLREPALTSAPQLANNNMMAASLGAGVQALSASQRPQVEVPKTNVTGHVVLGSMANERFSSESVLNMGQGIRSLSMQGGGEMSIRLKPDNLGELSLKVSTVGNRVGLKITASDARSQKILEGSLDALRDQLSAQNLVLSKVDILAASGAPAPSSTQQLMNSGQDDLTQGRNAHQAAIDLSHQRNGQNSQTQQGSRAWVGDMENGVGMRRSSQVAAAQAVNQARAPQSTSRIDLMA